MFTRIVSVVLIVPSLILSNRAAEGSSFVHLLSALLLLAVAVVVVGWQFHSYINTPCINAQDDEHRDNAV